MIAATTAVAIGLPRLLDDGVLDDANQQLGINGAACERLGINSDGFGGVCVMSVGRMELQVVGSEGRHLLLYCCKVRLVFKTEGLAFSVGLGKIGYIGSGTRIVDAGVSKSSFLAVQDLHGIGEKRAEVRPGVLTNGLFIPSANLQGKLWEQLHEVIASQNCRVHVEGKPGIMQFFDAVVLATKILVDGAARVVGSIKDGGYQRWRGF